MDTDENLAKRLQYGDTDALATLVTRHHNRLIGYLYRMTGGNHALAEDIAQDAFLRVIRAIHQYRYPNTFKPWLYAIATNLIRDHYKRAEMRYTMVDVDATSIPVPNKQDSAFEDADDARQVINALMTLPEHQRAVIVLRYYGECSLKEVAETLEIPVGTVKSRLSKGLKALRQILAKDYRHEA